MKQSKPRIFTNLLRSSQPSGKNSGIFSNSGVGQKMDKRPKTSPCGPGMSRPAHGDKAALKSAVHVPKKKSGSSSSGMSNSTSAAGKLRSYADHGEK